MKPEVVFGLEGAAWPALLLNAGGAVLRSNTAATNTFGAALAGESPPLSAIWSPENGKSPEEFFARWEQSPTVTADLKFRVASGATMKFTAAVCTFNSEGRKWFVLQLLPAVVPGPATAPVVSAMAHAPGETKAGPDAGGMMLKQKLECALQLARSVSLDFNNALTSILGHTSLLLSKAEAGHPWRHSLMEVEKSASRAAEIANELSVFSRQEKEAHRQPPGNLNVVVGRCVDFFRGEHGTKITWKTQLEPKLFSARVDEAKVQQALSKILENAVEAIAGGSGQIYAQTRNVDLTEPTQDRNVHLAAGAYVCIEIGDSGPGIEADILPRIFEPFYLASEGSKRGTGLGLSIAKEIVELHGGSITVDSRVNSGSVFTVRLSLEE